MTQQQIIDAGIDYTLANCPVCMGGAAFEDKIRQFNRNPLFEAGAKLAKEKLIEEITQWLSEELFEDPAEPNPFYSDDVKSKRYDTVTGFIEALKKAINE